MNHPTLSGKSGRAFCESLYHIAACDGLSSTSKDALTSFIQATGLELSLNELGATPHAYATSARQLESTWLRRLLIQACARMARVGGHLPSEKQRVAISNLGQSLGLSEDAAVAELDSPMDDPLDLTEWLSKLEVDYLSWDNFQQPGYFWKFPHSDIKIAEQAMLRVHEGQALLIRHEGEWTDLLAAGNYLLLPQTLPGYSQRTQWSGGPMQAEFFFVRTGPSGLLRWGLTEGVKLRTQDQRQFSLKAFGKCAIAFDNIPSVARRLLNQEVPNQKDAELRMGRIVAGRFAQALTAASTEPDTNLLELLSDMDQARDALAPRIRDALATSGISLHHFEIENMSAPEEIGLRTTSTRAKAMNRAGSEIMGGQSKSLLEPGGETGVLTSMDGDGQADSLAGETALDFPSTGDH